MSKQIFLCAINNIQSGACSEDCKFCTQSTKHKVSIEKYKQKPIDIILHEAKIAKKNKATGYCLVTAGASITDKKLDFICKIAYNISKEVPSLNLIACNGLASYEQLRELKKYGINSYNHNLETSKEYYKEICTTHHWEDRYQTCIDVNKAGLSLVCGGIFGMGENTDDRMALLASIATLNPKTVPLNFFHPNDALPIKKNINRSEAFDIIKQAKKIINPQKLMVAGGREITFGDEQYDIFNYGVNAIVIGNYLTTLGNNISQELKEIKKLGFEYE